MRAFILFLALIFVGDAWALPPDPEIKARLAALDSETHCYVFPGPGQGETRPLCVWWPRNAPTNTPLPVLYMADGMAGLHIAVLDLKAGLEAGTVAPMMIVAIEPREKPEDRASEYVQGWSGNLFDTHETWLIEKVIPWAETTKRASPDRTKRFIGGFSNGADLALALANKHPDVFGGALVHSPVGASASWVGEQAATQRWVVTGGTLEASGSVQRDRFLPREIAQALERRSAPLRVCIGRWAHEGRAWRQLSPGSLVWLMGLGAVESAEAPFERGKCYNKP